MFPWLSALASNVSSPILLSETTPEPSDFELAWSMLTTIFSWVVIGDFAFCGCFLFGAMFFKFMCFTKYPTDLSGIKPAEPTADTSLKGAELRPQRMELAKAHPKGLWRLDDQFYDLTEFVRHHPGGELAISQSEGTEISALFHSHHMRAIPESLLAKYRVQVEPATAARIPPCDYSFHEKGFFQTCKRRCNAYLKENNLKSGSEASTNCACSCLPQRLRTLLLGSSAVARSFSREPSASVLATASPRGWQTPRHLRSRLVPLGGRSDLSRRLQTSIHTRDSVCPSIPVSLVPSQTLSARSAVAWPSSR